MPRKFRLEFLSLLSILAISALILASLRSSVAVAGAQQGHE